MISIPPRAFIPIATASDSRGLSPTSMPPTAAADEFSRDGDAEHQTQQADSVQCEEIDLESGVGEEDRREDPDGQRLQLVAIGRRNRADRPSITPAMNAPNTA